MNLIEIMSKFFVIIIRVMFHVGCRSIVFNLLVTTFIINLIDHLTKACLSLFIWTLQLVKMMCTKHWLKLSQKY